MTATTFTPVEALVGGVLIGLSAVLMMLFLGRIMGISGIIGGLFDSRSSQEYFWRVSFLAGVVASPLVYAFASADQPVISASPDIVLMAVAGVLVGYGATTGSGCTSGHGVCGLARFSRRSAAAVVVFMSVAFLTVYIARHVF
jgi:uncharacterized protein